MSTNSNYTVTVSGETSLSDWKVVEGFAGQLASDERISDPAATYGNESLSYTAQTKATNALFAAHIGLVSFSEAWMRATGGTGGVRRVSVVVTAIASLFIS